jgi:hypothetical protein
VNILFSHAYKSIHTKLTVHLNFKHVWLQSVFSAVVIIE